MPVFLGTPVVVQKKKDSFAQLFADLSKTRPRKTTAEQANQATSSDGGAIPFWGDAPELYDTLTIGGKQVPGVVRVSGKGYEQRLDRKVIPGKHGEKITQLGNGPAEVDFDVQLWTEEHLEQFQAIVRLILNPPLTDNDPASKTKGKKKGPPPIAVYHPMLALFGVSHLTFTKIQIPEDKEGKGIYTARISAIQYIPHNQGITVKTLDESIVQLEPEGGAIPKQQRELEKQRNAPSATSTAP